MKLFRTTLMTGVAIAGLFFPDMVKADTVTATLNSVNQGVTANNALSVQVIKDSVNGAAVNSSETAGLFKWTTSSVTTGPFAGPETAASSLTVGSGVNAVTFSAGTIFHTFCVEINQNVSYNGSYTYKVGNLTDAPTTVVPMTVQTANFITDLWVKHYYQSVVPDTNGIASAAMQIAIWELIYDNGTNTTINTGAGQANDLLSGHVQFTGTSSSILAMANSFLSGLTQNTNIDVLALISNTNQDQSFIISPAPALESPLPAVAWGGIGLMGLTLVGKVRGFRRIEQFA